MKRILILIFLLVLCADCLAQQDPVEVVRTYIATLNDALSSPNDMTRRKKIEDLLGAGSPGIKDEIVERYNTKSSSRMLSGQYLAIFYDVIQNSSTSWIKVSIIGTPTVKEDRGTSVCATLQYSGAISLKTSSEFWIENGKITGIMSDELGIAKISRSGGGTPPSSIGSDGTGTTAGHEWVDLGLPSGTLWATCNVGANNPWEYGDYFAWGEIEPKSTYSWSNYKYANGADDKLTKYCNKSSYGNDGYTDSRTTLEKTDDAATANWGDNWRMPTQAQFEELYYSCTNEWTFNYQGKGVAGRIFKSKSNGNTIFLPSAGWKDKNGTLLVDEYIVYYWTSTLSTGYPYCGVYRFFNSTSKVDVGIGNRAAGRSVRPVWCSH